jgi:hypothetical protein
MRGALVPGSRHDRLLAVTPISHRSLSRHRFPSPRVGRRKKRLVRGQELASDFKALKPRTWAVRSWQAKPGRGRRRALPRGCLPRPPPVDDDWFQHMRAPRQCPRPESNQRTRFRKPLLYPLSYGGSLGSVALLSHGLDQAPGSLRRGSAAQVSPAGGDCSTEGRNFPTLKGFQSA